MTTKFNSSEKLVFTSSYFKNGKLQRNKNVTENAEGAERLYVLNLSSTFASHTNVRAPPWSTFGELWIEQFHGLIKHLSRVKSSLENY